MQELPHLPLIKLESDLPRSRRRGASDITPREPKEREEFSEKAREDCDIIFKEFKQLQEQYKGCIEPALIYRIDLKGSVKSSDIERLGLRILSVVDKKAIIVFSSDKHFNDFYAKLDEYVIDSERRKYPFLDAFNDLEKVDEKTKKGPHLSNLTLKEKAIVDVEFWFLGDDRDSVRQMDKWSRELRDIVICNGGKWISKLRTRSFYVMRMELSQELIDEIIKLPQIASIDIPSRTRLSIAQIKEESIENFDIIEPPQDATGVLVIDSGIVSGHPLLEKAVGEAKSFLRGKSPTDECGHGTSVAGLSLYGDIVQCISDKKFYPDCWLFSAKVLDENGEYDDQKLIESQFLKSLNVFLRQYPQIKVINLSIGNADDIIGIGKRQFRWASLIDETLYELSAIGREIIIVIPSGNFYDDDYNDYPDCLFNDESKLINPSTAALAITVGSISPGLKSSNPVRHPIAEHLGFPSPFTRTGPGLGGMVKPDLVEVGGDWVYPAYEDPSIGIVTVNKDFVLSGPFVVDNGTSISSAKISNHIAKLWNQFPSASANLIKALIISSCSHPKKFLPDRDRQIPLESFASPRCPRSFDVEKINAIYGHGLPNIIQACSSDLNRVVLLDESTIKLDSARFYEIPLPDSYYSISGNRELSVALCFDPRTKRTSVASLIKCRKV